MIFAKLLRFFVSLLFPILSVVEIKKSIKETMNIIQGLGSYLQLLWFAGSSPHTEVAVPPLCLPAQVAGAVPDHAPAASLGCDVQ